MRHTRSDTIAHELKHHLPFTLVASLVASVLVAIIFLVRGGLGNFDMAAFEILHPAHVLVSAAATATIFHRYKKSFLESVLIGTVGAILIGTLSDVIFPWISGNLLMLDTHFHLPLAEEPFLIISIAIIGSLIGIFLGLSKVSHLLHVFLSVFASLFYLLAFSSGITIWIILIISLVVFVAVLVPCCISDIVFPLLFIKRPCKKCGHWHN